MAAYLSGGEQFTCLIAWPGIFKQGLNPNSRARQSLKPRLETLCACFQPVHASAQFPSCAWLLVLSLFSPSPPKARELTCIHVRAHIHFLLDLVRICYISGSQLLPRPKGLWLAGTGATSYSVPCMVYPAFTGAWRPNLWPQPMVTTIAGPSDLLVKEQFGQDPTQEA